MKDNLTRLKDYMNQVLQIPDLEVRESPAGLSYNPESDECDPRGFVEIENIHAKPRITPEMVMPRTGVGFPDPKMKKTTKELVTFVEFPVWDEEKIFGRRTPEGGYKFSDVKIDRKPLGITIVEHRFGNKGRKQNDFRWSDDRFNKKEKIYSIIYHFLYLDELKTYVRVNPNHKKREKAEHDPMYELKMAYFQRLQEAENLENLCYEIFAEFRHEYATNFFPREVKAQGVVYSFHKDVVLDIGGKTTVNELINRLETKWVPFIELTRGYLDGLFLCSEISKDENAVLHFAVKELHVKIHECIKFLKQLDPELIFVSTNHDLYHNGEETVPGPVREMIRAMRKLLQPRKEKLYEGVITDEMHKYSKIGESYKGDYFEGYLEIKGDNFYPSLGEHIRSKEQYDEPANDSSEEKVKGEIKWYLEEKKKNEERERKNQGN